MKQVSEEKETLDVVDKLRKAIKRTAKEIREGKKKSPGSVFAKPK